MHDPGDYSSNTPFPIFSVQAVLGLALHMGVSGPKSSCGEPRAIGIRKQPVPKRREGGLWQTFASDEHGVISHQKKEESEYSANSICFSFFFIRHCYGPNMSPQNAFVKALTLNVLLFGDGACGR